MPHEVSFNQINMLQDNQALSSDSYILYQPNPTKQILLYDAASCSSVLTFLKMNNFRTTIHKVTNAEFMSENGRLPVVVERGSDTPICGFSEVFWHVTRKLNSERDLLMLAYMDWVETKFLEAEMYICWCHEQVLNDYTKIRYTHDLPWPVSSILFNRKRAEIQMNIGKKFKNFEDFLEKFSQFLTQLNKRIGSGPYCLSDTNPSCVDALIYGHTKTILSTNLNPKFQDLVNRQRRIMSLKELIDENYPS